MRFPAILPLSEHLGLLGSAPMRTALIFLMTMLSGWTLPGAERAFDFGGTNTLPAKSQPAGFRSTVAGQGRPGDWKVILEAVPSVLAPLSPQAPVTGRRPVLAQLARDRTDEHFPMLVYDEEVFGDFTLTTRFKIVEGVAEQMAGLAFRWQDERNYYYVRASALGGNFAFFKVVDGARSAPIAVKMPIEKGVWHELTVECKGTRIRSTFNGREVLPNLDDKSFNSGKFGFWTKSDSVSYFTDTRIIYQPRETLAQTLVNDAMKLHPRLLGLQILAPISAQPDAPLQVVASKDAGEIGQPGPPGTDQVLTGKGFLYAKNGDSVTVVLALRDWNGDKVAAVKVLMRTFPGQTEKNAVIRATPIVKSMEPRVESVKVLVQ